MAKIERWVVYGLFVLALGLLGQGCGAQVVTADAPVRYEWKYVMANPAKPLSASIRELAAGDMDAKPEYVEMTVPAELKALLDAGWELHQVDRMASFWLRRRL